MAGCGYCETIKIRMLFADNNGVVVEVGMLFRFEIRASIRSSGRV